MPGFFTSVDIANRTCQLCGVPRIFSFSDLTDQAKEIGFAYDKLRLVELQRNVWAFATRRVVLRPIDTTTLQLTPAAWSASNVYIMGSIVSYGGLIYICRGWLVTGSTTPDQSTAWMPYFGPLMVNRYDSGTAYFAGELVYSPTAENPVVYLAVSNTSDTPGVFPEWSSTTVYQRGQATAQGGEQLTFVPGNLPVFFTPGNLPVFGSLGFFQSLQDLNIGNSPELTPASWQNVPVAGQPDYMTGISWLRLDATVQSITIPYPLGSGPSSDTLTRNVYRLPNGYLRHAPAAPDPNEVTIVGGVTTLAPSDMKIENGFIVTDHVTPLAFRFIADMTDVTQMADLFCEGLAARIALDVGPVIVPKDNRNITMARVKQRYREVIVDARSVDAIERDASAPPVSPYRSVRF